MVYRIDRNNFHKNEKKATVYTPKSVSDFLFSILEPVIKKDGLIFDPCVGAGSLLNIFKNNGYRVLGVDVENQGFPDTIVKNYLELKFGEEIKEKPNLVLMNPPFNIDEKTKEYIKKTYSGRPLLPEVWLQKTIELFGKNVPIVMFTPYGFRLNQSCSSKRWQKFDTGEYPEITSIVSLPKDIFDGILFHSEIIMLNIHNIKPHYFFKDLN